MIQPSFLSSGVALKSGPIFHTILPVSLSMMARMLASRESKMMLSGLKRMSPWSCHLFGPR